MPWPIQILFILILLIGPNTLFADPTQEPPPEPEATTQQTAESPTDTPVTSSFKERWSEGWNNLKSDGKYLGTFHQRPTRKGILATSLIGAGIVTLILLDDEIRAEVQKARNDTTDKWEDRIEPFGHARNTALAAGAVYGTGKLFKNETVTETGRTLFEALAYTDAFDLAAKGFFGREEPNEGTRAKDFFHGSSFFPSGHTARSFAFATVLAQRHGKPAAFIAYPIATLVGLSRMERDVHWASDILAGAALGHVIARAIVYRRAEREAKRSRVNLAPFVSVGYGKASLVVRMRWD